jgi:Tat protein translocase TatC
VDERRLTFGEHLEELRGHVGRSAVYLVVAMCLSLLAQSPLMRFVTAPHFEAMREIAAARRAAALADREREGRVVAAARALDAALADARVGAADAALAARISNAFAVLAREAPSGATGTAEALSFDARLRVLGPTDSFFAHMKVALIAAIFFASPLIARELWGFVAAGLHPNEQRWVRLFGPLTYAFFVAGSAFGYYALIPQTLAYLADYGSADLFTQAVSVEGYIDLFFGLTLALGIVFELPLVLVFLSLVGFVTSASLREWRRYWIFAATVVAAVVSPTGDPLTLAICAVPLVLLYEVGIVWIRFLERRQEQST